MHVAYCNYSLLVICMVIFASVVSDTLLLALFNIKTVDYISCLAIFYVVVVVVVEIKT